MWNRYTLNKASSNNYAKNLLNLLLAKISLSIWIVWLLIAHKSKRKIKKINLIAKSVMRVGA
jgi:hypothetical protein